MADGLRRASGFGADTQLLQVKLAARLNDASARAIGRVVTTNPLPGLVVTTLWSCTASKAVCSLDDVVGV